MPNWWDEDAPDEGGGEGNWWESDAEPPKKLTGVASAWTPSGSAKPKKRSPLSLSENVQQQSTGLLSGLRAEAPNVLQRFANLGSDILQGGGDILSGRGSSDSRPNADIAKELLQREKDWKARQEFERSSAPAPNENLGTSIGRLGAKAAPQIAAGIATGGASIPVQAGVGGGLELLQSLSEGDTPLQAGGRTLLAGGSAALGPSINRVASWFKAPFAKYVDPKVLASAQRLGVDLPASSLSRSPVVQQAEALGSKLPGGQALVERAIGAQERIPEAAKGFVSRTGNADAVMAGTNIAQDVLGADASVAAREAMLAAEEQGFNQAQTAARQRLSANLVDPALAAQAPQALSGGLSSAKGRFRGVSSQLREGIDANLSGIAANPEDFIAEVDGLIAKGTLPPGDLAYLKGLKEAVSPRKMADIGGGQLVPVDQVPAEFRALVPTVDQPRTAAEILSQVRGMTQRLPYGQGEGVFSTPALKQGLAGKLKAEMGSIVSGADPDLGARLSAADQFHAENVGQFKTDAAKRIFKLAKAGDVSKVADVIQPQMATEELQQLLATTGARRAVSAKVLDDIIAKASDNTGAVVPEKLVREVNRWRPGNLDALLTRDQIDQLTALGRKAPTFQGPTGPALGPTTTGEFLGSGKLGTPIKGAFTSGNPTKVVELVIREDSTPQEIAAAMKSAGRAAPEIQANAVRRIFSIGDKERLTPKEVFNRYEAWGGRKKLESFLKPDQVQAIEDVINVSMAMGQSNRILHGSQTAFLGNIAALAAQAVRNPVQVAKTLATMIPSSYLMGTAKGQKWLTTGLGKATIPGKAARWTGIGSARADAELNASRRRRDIDALMAGEK